MPWTSCWCKFGKWVISEQKKLSWQIKSKKFHPIEGWLLWEYYGHGLKQKKIYYVNREKKNKHIVLSTVGDFTELVLSYNLFSCTTPHDWRGHKTKSVL